MTLYYIEEQNNNGYMRQYEAKSDDYDLAYSEFIGYARCNKVNAFMISSDKPYVRNDGSLWYRGCIFEEYSADAFHQVY